MTNELKQSIAAKVAKINTQKGQDKLGVMAKVSGATINHIINNKWSLISDSMWRKVMINLNLSDDWKIVPTNNFIILNDLLSAAHKNSMSIGISYSAGAGKTEAYRHYASTHKNVIYVQCKNTWSTKSYLRALLQAAGIQAEGTTEQMVETFTDHVISLEDPKVIVDQCDKLKDKQFDLFMDFYNDLDGHCSFTISGVPALEKRVKKGVLLDKTGYAEFWSRIGCRFIKLDPLSLNDVSAICNANGLYDDELIGDIFDVSMNDLRVVKRQIQKHFLVQSAKTKKSA